MSQHFPLFRPWIARLLAVLFCLLVLAGCGQGSIQYKGLGTAVASFDAGTRAYALAQQAEQYRRRNPSSNNYCVVSLFLNIPPRIVSGPSKVSAGYGDDITNHCEQVSLLWVQFNALPQIFRQYQLSKVNTIYVVLFTQVRACPRCSPTFSTWEMRLQQLVQGQTDGSSVQLSLFVWQIAPGSPSGFAPRDYNAGPYTQGPPRPNTRKPVPGRRQDLSQVYP